ncbi:ubiquitin carboxyl-terminal hydrolase 32-like [Zerene cesonia]|uniref:ubiquitin carboxyl-terminal hydrolase 32-like n=1 Tax=Zerene cesonia TaxID=33412 RepID=UPI0018E59390|nr:ubiquitin carboxyl-terminal hydrolase 32-like [Zerene cesonia]
MGAKDSKPSFISYEDAVKRVSDSELRRLREAFKRSAGVNGTSLSLDAFVHEVLCDGVPYEVAEWLYQACGGTKRGIAFKELLCGIIVLTKGNLEEKIKFLWTLYVNNQSENGSYIYKKDFARALHLENTSLPVTETPRTGEILTSLFGVGEKVTFEQFRSWLLIHKDATILSKWLLYNRRSHVHDLETPTFYQSLAGVTHLEERDIIELEKCFWSLRSWTATGELDAGGVRCLLAPPLPRAAVDGVFLAFDENRDGHIDFKELCCGLSAACRGPRTERLKFCFKVFDLDRDGVLNKKELVDMVGILCTVANEALKNQGSRASTPSDEYEPEKSFDPEVILLNLRDKLVTAPRNGSKPVFQLGPMNEENIITLTEDKEEEKEYEVIGADMALAGEDFLIWSVESAAALVTPFLELLFEVCHVLLGLRPSCKHQERDIVLGWLRRETCRGLAVGQFWYLVSAEWWGAWLLHAAGAPHACCRNTRNIDDAIVCDDSFTTNSTESMGSLMWRAETSSVRSAESAGAEGAGSEGAAEGAGEGAGARRPDSQLAAEAWAQYAARNASIMTELFYGQLKSRVRCSVCGHESLRFDTFNMLSLPLPMEAFVRAEVKVILLDGSVPVKYGLRVNSEGTYYDLKKSLSELCGLSPDAMLLALVSDSRVSALLQDGAKVAAATACDLLAYQVPPAARAPLLPHAPHAPHEPRAPHEQLAADECDGRAESAEVSVGAPPSSLCMPALFCFKVSPLPHAHAPRPTIPLAPVVEH